MRREFFRKGGLREEGGNAVEEKLKDLMQELGNAINESLSDSDRIAAAIGEIKRAGYDVFLVLEATIGFNKREESDEESEVETEAEPKRRFEANGKIKLTSQDQKFLRALKIAIDDESH
jgi:hypothetical protein